MTSWEGNDAQSATGGPPPGVWRRIARGRLLATAGIAAIGGGIVLNWGWLTAVGAAPIILSAPPCAAMCALGLCMRRGSSDACSSHRAAKQPPAAGTDRLADPAAGMRREEETT